MTDSATCRREVRKLHPSARELHRGLSYVAVIIRVHAGTGWQDHPIGSGSTADRAWADAWENQIGSLLAPRASFHAPVMTLEELDALDESELLDGYRSAERGDPEPGANHSWSYHHGWRVRMMDLGEIPIPPEHRKLTSEWVARNKRVARS